MTTARKLMTAEEFEAQYTGKKAELWFGEVRMMAPVGYGHGDEAGELIVWLRTFARANALGFVPDISPRPSAIGFHLLRKTQRSCI